MGRATSRLLRLLGLRPEVLGLVKWPLIYLREGQDL